MSQTSYSIQPAVGRAGVLADSRTMVHTVSRIMNGLAKAGLAAFRSTGFGQPGSNNRDPGSVFQNPSPAAAASAVSILASGGASSLSSQVISGTAFNGAGPGIPGADMTPARKINLVLSNHANWSATTAVLTGVNHLGATVSENLSIPSGGNATVSTVGYFKQITSLSIPAQGGTSGTFTIGVGALSGTLAITDFEGFVIYDPSTDCPVVPNTAGTHELRDSYTASLLYKGAMWVNTENAVVAGAPVFVRIASGTFSQLGAVRGDADTASAIVIPNARFVRDSAIGGLNIIELY